MKSIFVPRGYITCSYILWMTKNGSHEIKIFMVKHYIQRGYKGVVVGAELGFLKSLLFVLSKK